MSSFTLFAIKSICHCFEGFGEEQQQQQQQQRQQQRCLGCVILASFVILPLILDEKDCNMRQRTRSAGFASNAMPPFSMMNSSSGSSASKHSSMIRRGPLIIALVSIIVLPIRENKKCCPSVCCSRRPSHQCVLCCVVLRVCDASFSLLMCTYLHHTNIVLVHVLQTELSDEELKSKLRDTSGGHPRVDTGPYQGKLWKTDQTLGRTLLGETPYARCDVHSVMVEEGQQGDESSNKKKNKKIINDWIFMVQTKNVHGHDQCQSPTTLTTILSLSLSFCCCCTGRTGCDQRGSLHQGRKFFGLCPTQVCHTGRNMESGGWVH